VCWNEEKTTHSIGGVSASSSPHVTHFEMETVVLNRIAFEEVRKPICDPLMWLAEPRVLLFSGSTGTRLHSMTLGSSDGTRMGDSIRLPDSLFILIRLSSFVVSASNLALSV